MLYKIKHGAYSYKYNNKYYILNIVYKIITLLIVGIQKYSDINRKDKYLYDEMCSYKIDLALLTRNDIIGLRHKYQEALINKDLLEAYVVREELCQYVFNSKNPIYDYLKLQYYLENNEINKISNIVKKPLGKYIFSEYANLLHLFNNSSKSTLYPCGDMYRDELMLNMIHNQKVVILGPMTNYNSLVINSSDVVVSLNLTKDIMVNLPCSVDISYLKNCSKISSNKSLYDDCDLICIYRWQSVINYSGAFLQKIRLMRNPSYLISNRYVPNMLQNILYDVIMYEPAHVVIYGFDGYSTPNKLYNNEYKETFKVDKMANNIRKHDPISNFLFTKTLMSNYNIESDSFGAIFRSDVKNYLKRLEHNI